MYVASSSRTPWCCLPSWAPDLPSNIDYLAENNGLASGKEAIEALASTNWVLTMTSRVHQALTASSCRLRLATGSSWLLLLQSRSIRGSV